MISISQCLEVDALEAALTDAEEQGDVLVLDKGLQDIVVLVAGSLVEEQGDALVLGKAPQDVLVLVVGSLVQKCIVRHIVLASMPYSSWILSCFWWIGRRRGVGGVGDSFDAFARDIRDSSAY
jgi:hypothetical protein